MLFSFSLPPPLFQGTRKFQKLNFIKSCNQVNIFVVLIFFIQKLNKMQNKLEPIYAQVSRIFLSFSLFQGNFYRSIKYIRCCSYFYYRGLRNCIELIKIAISILNSTQFSFFIRSPFVSIYVCVCVPSNFRYFGGKNEQRQIRPADFYRGVSVLSKRGGERTRSS